MHGYFLKGHDQLLRINLGADMVGTSMQADANGSMGAGSNAPAEYDRRYLAVTYMQGTTMPAERMGVAHVACIRGCSCKRLLLAFRAETNTGIAATEVRHVDCALLF
jgi:hypothetical protein